MWIQQGNRRVSRPGLRQQFVKLKYIKYLKQFLERQWQFQFFVEFQRRSLSGFEPPQITNSWNATLTEVQPMFLKPSMSAETATTEPDDQSFSVFRAVTTEVL